MNQALLALAAVTLLATGFIMMNQAGSNLSNEAIDADTLNSWNDFKILFSKSYADATEESYRMTVFFQNLEEVRSHNAKRLSYQKAINSFADLTNAEFKAIYLGYTPKARESRNLRVRGNESPAAQARASIDWTAKGQVQPVKDQGACGSCWAFSAVGSVEATYAIFKNENVRLSEQQLVSCSGDYGNYGCDGGLMDSAFEYIIDDHPLTLNEQYPYSSGTGKTGNCKAAEEQKGKYTIGSYIDVEENNPDDLYSKLTIQPVSVAVDASVWSFYSGGVLLASQCNDELNHGVLLTGYVNGAGNDDYWVVKNSWGTSWGIQGYIHLQANFGTDNSGTCGIAAVASYTEL